MQRVHAPLRSKLLQKQDEQREGEKLYGTDEGHAAVRPPEEPAQMEKNDGHGGKKRSAVCRAEQSPAEQEKVQNDQDKTDRCRSPGKETAAQKRTEQDQPLQGGKDTRLHRGSRAIRRLLSKVLSMMGGRFLHCTSVFIHCDECTSEQEYRMKQRSEITASRISQNKGSCKAAVMDRKDN